MTNKEFISNIKTLLQLYEDGLISFSTIRSGVKETVSALDKQEELEIRKRNYDEFVRFLNRNDVKRY